MSFLIQIQTPELKKMVIKNQPQEAKFTLLFYANWTFPPRATPPLPHLSVVLFVLQSTGVAGAESRAIGISVCPTAIISFGLTTHLLFTFTPEIGQAEAGEVAGAGDDGHENELLFFFYSFHSLSGQKKMWCHILSEPGSRPTGVWWRSRPSHLSALV